MGVIIEGDPRQRERLYTMAEISEVCGVNGHTLRSRARRLGIICDKGGFTYQEALQMMKTPKRVRGQRKRPEAVEQLKRQLKKDGYL